MACRATTIGEFPSGWPELLLATCHLLIYPAQHVSALDLFSIITPSFRTRKWLPLCVASVADQQGVSVEHIVQDAGSDDGAVEWLQAHPDVRSFVERDNGMYDAINRGLRRAQGEILAHLNADEQYLPGALAAVHDCFRSDPRLDVLYADTVVVDGAGQFICCRKSMRPSRALMYVQNPTITSSIFFHRRVIERHHLFFDPDWRVLGDAVWMRASVRLGLRTAVLRRYTSAFADTGDNLDLSPAARSESLRLRRTQPDWARMFEVPLRTWGRLRRLVHGTYHQRPFAYEIYLPPDPGKRVRIQVAKPTCVWWNRAPRRAGGYYRRLKLKMGGRRGKLSEVE